MFRQGNVSAQARIVAIIREIAMKYRYKAVIKRVSFQTLSELHKAGCILRIGCWWELNSD